MPSLEEPENSLGVGLGLGSVEGWDLRAAYAGRFGDGAEDHGFLLGFSTEF